MTCAVAGRPQHTHHDARISRTPPFLLFFLFFFFSPHSPDSPRLPYSPLTVPNHTCRKKTGGGGRVAAERARAHKAMIVELDELIGGDRPYDTL